MPSTAKSLVVAIVIAAFLVGTVAQDADAGGRYFGRVFGPYVDRGCPSCGLPTAGGSSQVEDSLELELAGLLPELGKLLDACGQRPAKSPPLPSCCAGLQAKDLLQKVDSLPAILKLLGLSHQDLVKLSTCARGRCEKDLRIPPDQAILEVWVPKGVKLTINGYETRNLDARGVHLGSRKFILRGLKPDEPNIFTIDATMHYGPDGSVTLTQDKDVQGGKRIKCGFPKAEFRAHCEAPKPEPSLKSKAEAAASKAEAEASRAEAAAIRAEAAVGNAQTATGNAQTATGNAQTAAGNALAAAIRAETAVANAHATANAQTATANAQTATASAQTATANAQTATANAQTGTANAQTATANAQTATANAQTATANAQTATANAQTGTANAQTATGNAQTATANAQTATANAQTATANAQTATANAQTATANAQTGTANAQAAAE